MAGPVESVDSSAMPWSRLWATGVLHSCATGIHGNYDGEVLAFWQGQFDLAGDGARILDVGTGNGALLLLARERATRRGIGLTLLGVDIADIEPGRAVAGGADRFAGIEFHPRTSVCALPFADGEIDLVCSQFGFEYAPRAAAIREIARVAGGTSQLALVLHRSDSIIARVSAPQREGLRLLGSECPIVPLARRMVPVLFEAARGRQQGRGHADPGHEAVRQSFNRAASALMDGIERLPQAQVLRNTAQQVRRALELAYTSPAQADAMLARVGEGLLDEEARLEQLERAMLSADGMRELSGQLSGIGYTVQWSPLEQKGERFAWALEATRG